MFCGSAYAAMGNGNIGGVLEYKIGRSAFLSLGCQGTSGTTKTNSIANLNATGVQSRQDLRASIIICTKGWKWPR